MTKSTQNKELSDLAIKLTNSSSIYSNALAMASLNTQTASIYASISKTVTAQLKVDRNLLSSTDAMLKHINICDTISPNIKTLSAANTSLTSMAKQLSSIETMKSLSLSKIFEKYTQSQKSIQNIDISNAIKATSFKIDTTRMLSTSLSAQVKLANFDSLGLGRIAGLGDAFSSTISTNLANLTSSYKSLINLATTHDSLAKRLSLITTYAPIEYYREVKVVETITVDDVSKTINNEPIETAITNYLPSIDSLLEKLDERLLPVLHGAHQSLHDDNPDRARHVTTSIRELFTQVLHALAPDKEIQDWTSKSNHFHENRPTRRARLLFICRHIDCNPLSKFIQDDVKAALSLVDALNSGTHGVESHLSDAQLASIVARMESLLIFLLQVHNNY